MWESLKFIIPCSLSDADGQVPVLHGYYISVLQSGKYQNRKVYSEEGKVYISWNDELFLIIAIVSSSVLVITIKVLLLPDAHLSG